MSREQIVRDTAYAIWEAEGKPEGRDAEHWRQAEARVAASLTGAAGKAKARASKPATKDVTAKAPVAEVKTIKAPAKKSTGTVKAKG